MALVSGLKISVSDRRPKFYSRSSTAEAEDLRPTAICWILELMPLAVTALLPVALFLILGVASTAYVSVQYLNKTCMLFVGGKSNKWGIFG